MKKNKLLELFLLSLLTLFVFSCEVGLGEAVDVMGPEVKLSSPVVSQSVTPMFVITGSASDDYGVTSITIDIEGDEFKENFKWDGNAWYVLRNGDWIGYPTASNSGDAKNLQFSIPVNASAAISGHEYSITTKATDAFGNEGAKTKDERNIIIDINEPVVSIIEPMGLENPDDPEFNTYVLRNNSVLPKIKNGTFEISGSQREDTNLDYLVVYLDKEKTTIAPNTIKEYPVSNPLVRKEIHGDNLRNWSTTVTPDDFTDKSILAFDRTKDGDSQGHILRLVTESHDQAGNIELKSQRWFKFNNGADIPWINADFGFPNTPEGIAESKHGANRYYPRCSIQGQAYDDDGIKSIKIKIYDETGTEELFDASIKDEDLEKAGYPTYKAWSFNVLAETRTLIVKIDVEDINGIKGDQFVRAITVSDVNPPRISNIKPANGESALGNEAGSFSFSGDIDDDGMIKCVKIVRIASRYESDQMNYLDEDYSEWAKCTEANKATPYVDSHGNKIWWLELSNETHNETTDRYYRSFNKTFNIFTDFGISKTEPMKNQKFVILAHDVGGSANVESYSLQGDINPPELTIDAIYLNEKINDSDHYFTLDPNKPVELPKPFVRDDDLKITDKIKIVGKWKDDSTDNWISTSLTADKYVDLTLTIDNYKKTISTVVYADGTWETKDFIEPLDSSVSVINASIVDWGGNPTSTSRSYYVNSSEPTLTRIGAETPDGSYKAGSVIKITMEFNKAVEFLSASGEPPYLKLNAGNNKRIAVYDGSSNKTSKHIFTYTVQANDDITEDSGRLNVIGIEKNGNKWIDATAADADKAAEIKNLQVPASGGASLGGSRKIIIDTKVPSLTAINLLSGAGWNKAGKAIFVEAQFSEQINITPENLQSLKMKFSNNEYSAAATRTGPDTLLFKYVIGDNDGYTKNLQVSQIDSTGYSITDIAGNIMSSIDLNGKNLKANEVKVDTINPPTPVINNLPAPSTIYADSFTFEISGWDEDVGSKKYTLDGSAWMDYTEAVTVSNNGNYSISAKQTDLAGNESSASAPVEKTLNKNLIINSITSQQSDGTYTTGDDIIIEINCSEKIVVNTSSAKLKLNTTPVRYANYLSGSGTDKLLFKYTVAEGDVCTVTNGLTVSSFDSDVKEDVNGIDFSSRCTIPASNNLANNRTIKVITGQPKISSISVDQTGTDPVLKVTFDRPVSKNVGAGGYISIEQTYEKSGNTVYLAPAVLTKDQYNTFKGVNSAIDTYYEKGINGVNKSGDNYIPDLSEKYVLKFSYTGTTENVVSYFKNAVLETKKDADGNVIDSRNILKVWIPIASSKVTIDSSNSSIMKVTLTGSYKLPVKGAEYTITVPKDAAVDEQGHTNPDETTGTSPKGKLGFTLGGVEKAVIRIDKSECTVSGGSSSQPLRAQVKMDCQTPGKSVKYSISTVETKTKNINGTTLPSGKTTPVEPNSPETAVPATGTYKADTALYIGDSTNTSSGYKITIDAYPDGTNVHSYEIAYRSVVRLQAGTPSVGGSMGGFSSPENMNKVYIRGGDSESGNSTTVGFPLSWNSGDFGKVKLMASAKDGDTNYWYYVSWNISVNLYYGFLCGNTGSSDADTMAKGPRNWCWATCSWVSRKNLYYLRPGTSFTMVPTNSYNNGNFQYQGKHLEYRAEATQKSGYGVLVNPSN